MAEAKAQAGGEQDQSMEEILQSIRRIIAEESDEAKPDEAANGDVRGSDVLELTEIVDEPMNQSADVLSQIDQALAPTPQEREPTPESSAELTPEPESQPSQPEAAIAMPAPEPEPDSLLSRESASASAAAMRHLTENATREVTRQVEAGASFRSGQTIEELTMEALRPMLKSWLDANLPAIVERIVEKEVRRLSSL